MDNLILCNQYKAKYEEETSHCNTEIGYISECIGKSKSQTTRYIRFEKLIPEIKELFLSGVIKAYSLSDYISYKSPDQQMKICDLLKTAHSHGIYMARDRVVRKIVKAVSDNPSITWKEIARELDLSPEHKRQNKMQKQCRNPECKVEIGDRFVRKIATLLPARGYKNVQINKRKSWDYGADIIATDKFNQKVVFQLRYHQPGTKESKGAVVTAAKAKENYKADRAIAVTSTFFTAPTLKLAREMNIELWNAKKLIYFLKWDGII